MVRKSSFLFLGGSLFVLFVFLSFLVQKNLFTTFDFNMTVRLQDHVSRRFDGLFSFLSLLGSFEVMGILLAILLVLRRKISGLIILAAFGAIHVFELYGKFFVAHPPPPYMFFRNVSPLEFPSSYVRPGSSYPSGHSARAAFLSVFLAILIWRSKKLSIEIKLLLIAGLIIYDITMFVSRVYLGEHWTTDVIGGAMLGAALMLLSATTAL